MDEFADAGRVDVDKTRQVQQHEPVASPDEGVQPVTEFEIQRRSECALDSKYRDR
jgi:hypothetical protein